MSERSIVTAAIQPFVPKDADEHAEMAESAWALAGEAVERGARLIVLPEYLNAMGLAPDEVARRARETEEIRERARECCRRGRTWLLLPLVEERNGRRFNTAHLVDPSGEIVFTYDKTHLTLAERRDYGLTAGNVIEVARTDFGRVGVMVCYDVYFPEVARILSLKGADIILFPSLQRSDTPERCMLLNRVRAMDNTCHLVRSSFGQQRGGSYVPGEVHGHSYIVAPDGTVLSDAGLGEGIALATTDLGNVWKRPRCGGMGPQAVRDFLAEDRRPELYGPIAGDALVRPLPG